jgi:predicted DNA binding CopG/RHH family protein
MERATGAKDGNGMRKKIKYTDEPMQMGERITEDFLPPPSQLVKRESTTKVTLELTQSSLAFFKRQAKRERVPYQRMIRGLIDAYAKHQEASM